ncbi:hypothetical protein ACFL6I_09620 [candidate division KSB1 bacterium]
MNGLEGTIVSGEYKVPFKIEGSHIEGYFSDFLKNVQGVMNPQNEEEKAVITALKSCMKKYKENEAITCISISNNGSSQTVSLKDPIVMYVSPHDGGWQLDGELVISDEFKEQKSIYEDPHKCRNNLYTCLQKMGDMTKTFFLDYKDKASDMMAKPQEVGDKLLSLKGVEEKMLAELNQYNQKTLEDTVEENKRRVEVNMQIDAENDVINEANIKVGEHNAAIDLNIMYKREHPILAWFREVFGEVTYERRDSISNKPTMKLLPLELQEYNPPHVEVSDTTHVKINKRKHKVFVLEKEHDGYGSKFITDIDPLVQEQFDNLQRRNDATFEELKEQLNEMVLFHSENFFKIIEDKPDLNVDSMRHPVSYAQIFARVIVANIEYNKKRRLELEESKEKCLSDFSTCKEDLEKMNKIDEGYHEKDHEADMLERLAEEKFSHLKITKANLVSFDRSHEDLKIMWKVMHAMYLRLFENIELSKNLLENAKMYRGFAYGAKGINEVDMIVEQTWEPLREIADVYKNMFDEEAMDALSRRPLAFLEEMKKELGMQSYSGKGKVVAEQGDDIVDTAFENVFGVKKDVALEDGIGVSDDTSDEEKGD